MDRVKSVTAVREQRARAVLCRPHVGPQLRPFVEFVTGCDATARRVAGAAAWTARAARGRARRTGLTEYRTPADDGPRPALGPLSAIRPGRARRLDRIIRNTNEQESTCPDPEGFSAQHVGRLPDSDPGSTTPIICGVIDGRAVGGTARARKIHLRGHRRSSIRTVCREEPTEGGEA